ncbi:LAO/AO transport system kinase [Marinitoga hydrogenitolerans DSM 16785]|uniref:LAO/AO transport system kinase n=1 Tax=Marinitoga hydrogenitolerans (strain DSM 16785 / JCM 12826 / AT1271) TaxID=1122195 RepID=A0A1M4YS48_MARH1|nr:methylmalonyl Co-A mutase-associated GTPase MeaB [Marinitoga hydrogenitolerans]SHF08614.1 LAO/AO transport system kinase [Marinitoga hydrogenitolerans DSM 16785]
MQFQKKLDHIIEKFKNGEKYALAQIISLVENNINYAWDIIEQLPKPKKETQIIGITGSPGAGKSTTLSKMVNEWSKKNLKIGILAVDPSSPFSGGAFLGDRIRMRNLSGKSNIYIRSVASRGSVGGLCDSIYDIVDVMKSFGFDKIIIETVGAGQSEIEVIFVADTILLILSPNTGDEIQMFKAGIMEIADAYVVNKIDLPEADKFILQLKNTLSLESETKSKVILPISAIRNDGIKETINWIDNHFNEIKNNGEYDFRMQRRMKRRVRSSIIRNIDSIIESSNFDFNNMPDLKAKIMKYICEVNNNEKN